MTYKDPENLTPAAPTTRHADVEQPQDPSLPSEEQDQQARIRADKKLLKQFQSDLYAAEKVYEGWEKDFNCERLEDYYVGHHWDERERENYTINMCFPSVETRIPSLMFYNPKARVRPRPGRSDDPGSASEERAKLLEDTADTFILDEGVGFFDETRLAMQEAHYRFGVVQVGYTADFTENPNAQKPLLNEDGEPLEIDGQPVMPPQYNLETESLYVKRIPAKTFRVSHRSHNILERNEWCGYYEWMHPSDIKNNPRFVNTDKIRISGALRKEYDGVVSDESTEDAERRKGMIKVWRRWDYRTKMMYAFTDDCKTLLIPGEPFKFLPFAVLRFHPILDEFYPVPVMYNWTSPQDEMNETRHMQKIHRKRFYRRYLRLRGAVSPEEWRKLENGGDGVSVEVGNLDCVKPLEDAPLDSQISRNIPNTREDFMHVSGITGEQKGFAEAETATQASLIDTNSRIRESQARVIVSRWLAKVIKLMILTARERMALPFWVQANVDPLGPAAMMETQRVAAIWQMITAPELGEFDFDVSVDIEALSPVTEDSQRNQWGQVLGILSQPALVILLSNSDLLLRRTLSQYGIRSDRDIQEIKQAMQFTLMVLQAMSGAGAPPGVGGGGKPPGGIGGPPRKPALNAPPAAAGPAGPPGMQSIMGQLMGQTGMAGPRRPM